MVKMSSVGTRCSRSYVERAGSVTVVWSGSGSPLADPLHPTVIHQIMMISGAPTRISV